MRNRPLTTFRLSLENLKRKPLRTAGLIVIVSLTAFVIFAGGILSASMENGLGSLRERLGADLMIVPTGYDEGAEGIILRGEPAYFYFDKSVEEQLARMDGIKNISAQFFLTSLNQDCCDVPVQIIGYDPGTDFSISPWISEVYDDTVNDGEIVIGSDITADTDNQLKLFNEEYRIAARLEETGTGLDQAVYANMNTINDIFSAAKKSNFSFIEKTDPRSSVSSILIKLEDGCDPEVFTRNIRSSFDGLQVIRTKSMINDIADNLNAFIGIISVFVLIIAVIALLMLTFVFSMMANERKKEFAVLRALGASCAKLSRLVFCEAAIVSAAGGILGTGVSMVFALSFSTWTGDSLNLPYMQPGADAIIILAAAAIIISLVLGPLAAVYAAARLSRREVSDLLREGE